MAAGRLEVEIIGRVEKLEAALNKAESKVKKTGKTLDDEMSSPLGKMTVKAGKLFAAMGAIEGATKLASTAASGLQGMFAAMNGDADAAQRAFDAMAETAKSLPFGIGPVVAAFEQILFTVSGLNEQMAEQEEMLKRIADLDRQVAEARARKDVLQSLETQVKLAGEMDVLRRADLEYMADFTRLQEEHEQRIRESVGKSSKERERIRKDSEKQLELQRELSRLRMEATIQAETERREAEKIAQLEQEKLLVLRDQAEAKREQEIADREAAREEERKNREAEKAAQALLKQEEERRKQQQAAATAVSSANTAFGTFKFGQIRQSGPQEKAAAHMQSMDEGINRLIQLVSVGMRGIGFG